MLDTIYQTANVLDMVESVEMGILYLRAFVLKTINVVHATAAFGFKIFIAFLSLEIVRMGDWLSQYIELRIINADRAIKVTTSQMAFVFNTEVNARMEI